VFVSSIRLAIVAILAAVVLSPGLTRAQEGGIPTALDLLPPETVLLLSVPDATELVDRMKESSGGQMLEDPDLRPLAEQLYSSLLGLTTRVEEQLGVSVEQMLKMPQGEVSIAVVPPTDGPLGVVVLFDAGENADTMSTLLDRGIDRIQRDGGNVTTRQLAGREVRVATNANESFTVFWIEEKGAFLLCTSESVMTSLIDAWDGGAPETLRDNQHFATIMSRCRGEEDESPQFRWFIDPVNLARGATRGNGGAQLALAVLPIIGLDGLLGVGGTIAVATEQFDSLIHAHLLLDQPRTGVLEMLALIAGETEPEAWVPDDAVNYWTLTWDFDTTYRELEKLVDGFQGEGAFRGQLSRPMERVGLDFEKDVLNQLHGRVSIFRWIEPPARPESTSAMIGFKLKNPEEAMQILESVINQFPDRFDENEYSGTRYWTSIPRPRPVEPGEEPRPDLRPRLTVGILGDYLLITDRFGTMEEAILTSTQPGSSLGETLEYKLIASRIRRELKSARPGMMAFQRPEQALRFVYDLVQSDEFRDSMRDRVGETEAFQAIDRALEENPLPPFETLQKYLAPGGNLVTDDDTGFHYMEFTLRRKK
jgi:hypothetical protein